MRLGGREMASSEHKRRLFTAGGTLSIIGGVFQINNGVVFMAFFLTYASMWPYWPTIPFLPGLWFDYRQILVPGIVGWRPPIVYFIAGLTIFVLGILAVVGGISAVRRKRFGLSLAGAICALPSVILGILAVVFVSMGKRGSRVEEQTM
jgi:hypothetical protein